jgi:AmiR/NasT family two-component response regulator
MGAQGCTPDEAFDLLRRASQRENVKLRDIAARIVERASAPDGAQGPS